MSGLMISKRAFGKTGIEVTCVGLGGEGILRTFGKEQQAREVIECAIEEGITYFDCARAYAGSESYYGMVWSEQPERRKLVFQAGKSAERSKKGALADLDKTLATMRIDHLDLWQIHDVRTQQEIEMISAPGGALEAFCEAKSSGKTRFIGVTGHHDPDVLTQAVNDWPVDSVMMPVNPVEGALGGFFTKTLPAAMEKRIAVIGMKVLGGSHYISSRIGVTAELLIRYALSHPISVAIIGCSSVLHVGVLASAGKKFQPMNEAELHKIDELFKPFARTAAFYRGAL